MGTDWVPPGARSSGANCSRIGNAFIATEPVYVRLFRQSRQV
jgi:hypothetical protein